MGPLNTKTAPATSHPRTYIGRGTLWGNPYVLGKDGSRKDVLRAYAKLMNVRLNSEDKPFWDAELAEMGGTYLTCHCAPKACHGDILLGIINARAETANAAASEIGDGISKGTGYKVLDHLPAQMESRYPCGQGCGKTYKSVAGMHQHQSRYCVGKALGVTLTES